MTFELLCAMHHHSFFIWCLLALIAATFAQIIRKYSASPLEHVCYLFTAETVKQFTQKHIQADTARQQQCALTACH